MNKAEDYATGCNNDFLLANGFDLLWCLADGSTKRLLVCLHDPGFLFCFVFEKGNGRDTKVVSELTDKVKKRKKKEKKKSSTHLEISFFRLSQCLLKHLFPAFKSLLEVPLTYYGDTSLEGIDKCAQIRSVEGEEKGLDGFDERRNVGQVEETMVGDLFVLYEFKRSPEEASDVTIKSQSWLCVKSVRATPRM